jgi:hypothetical protein
VAPASASARFTTQRTVGGVRERDALVTAGRPSCERHWLMAKTQRTLRIKLSELQIV